ncbi:hypothetical protein D5086_000038 [Populus alba]|uniref:Uncharacterized protein n=1 Tax=Populus alba TaxID=43335 RepID=A0ACC4CVZ1_POPAL
MAFEDCKPYVETAGFSLLLTLCFPVLLSRELPEAAMVETRYGQIRRASTGHFTAFRVLGESLCYHQVARKLVCIGRLEGLETWVSHLPAASCRYLFSSFDLRVPAYCTGCLFRELNWLIEDSLVNRAHSPLCFSISQYKYDTSGKNENVVLRISLDDLYQLWKQTIEERRPSQYIVGCEHWRDLVLSVQEGVLIPGPNTELIVDLVSDVVSNNEELGQGLWADVGTGSGAIAIGIRRIWGSYGTDLSQIAVLVATQMCLYGLQDVIEVRQGSWFEPLKDVEGQLVDGGTSGIDYLVRLRNGASAMLKPDGFFAFETKGEKQCEFLVDCMQNDIAGSFCNLNIAGMSRVQGPSSLKRKRPELNSPVQSLTEHERILYDVIRSKQDIGIWTRDMKKEAKLPDNVVNKSLKALTVKNLIKEVVNIQNKGRKHFMATEFEPSKEITGGAWYLEGSLDTEFIESLRQLCKRQIEKKGVATLEEVTDMINSYPAFNVEVTKQQIDEILRTLILDNAVMEVKSNGMGEFASIPFGKVCYRYISKGALGGEPKAGALASIPCGVCPRISHCTPDGIISPKTCVYYQKWLDF